MTFYDYGLHFKTEGQHVVDEEPPPLKDAKILPNGARIISK
jgi:hypothetical protein